MTSANRTQGPRSPSAGIHQRRLMPSWNAASAASAAMAAARTTSAFVSIASSGGSTSAALGPMGVGAQTTEGGRPGVVSRRRRRHGVVVGSHGSFLHARRPHMRKTLLGFAALVAAAMLLVPASNAAKPSGPTLSVTFSFANFSTNLPGTYEADAYQQVHGHSALVASTTFSVS